MGAGANLIIFSLFTSLVSAQHWWNWENVLDPYVSPAFTPLPGQRFTHVTEKGKYSPEFNDVIVDIPKAGLGTFVGFSMRVNYDYTWSEWPAEKGRLVNVFLGIPYAAPPVGDNRLRYPRPAYLDTRYMWFAKEYKPACLQPKYYLNDRFQNFTDYSEDCLYLNIFYPNRTWEPLTTLYPVVVHIHGGSFVYGSSHMYPGHALASTGLVVVTFNYRLGPLGFLSTGDFASLGNYGMWDQLEALTWVRENIWWFRGDPERITLMGESAGGASVGLHLVSPASRDRGLYHQAIMMSGSELNPWAVSIPSLVRMRDYSFKLGGLLNCPTHDTYALVYCLRYFSDVQHLVDVATDAEKLPHLPGAPEEIWTPVVDGLVGFLPRSPREERDQDRFAKVPFLAGVVHDEASYKARKLLKKWLGADLSAPITDSLVRQFIEKFLIENRVFHMNETAEELFMRYTWWSNVRNTTARREIFISMLSDFYINSGVEATMRYQSQHTQQAYFYEFAYRSPNDTISPDVGIYHGVEIPFLFGMPFMNSTFFNQLYPKLQFKDANRTWYYPHDHNISEYMMIMWSYFITYGNPTPYEFRNLTWQNYSQDAQPYLHFYVNSSIRQNFRQSHLAFWRDRFQSIGAPLPPSDIEYFYPPFGEQIATYILSVLLLLGMFVCVLLIVWLCRRPDPDAFTHQVRSTPGTSGFQAGFQDKFANYDYGQVVSPPMSESNI